MEVRSFSVDSMSAASLLVTLPLTVMLSLPLVESASVLLTKLTRLRERLDRESALILTMSDISRERYEKLENGGAHRSYGVVDVRIRRGGEECLLLELRHEASREAVHLRIQREELQR